MQSTIKRCTLAIIMCGLSAIGMAQEKLIDEDFSDFTIVQGWVDGKAKTVKDWSVYWCEKPTILGNEVDALTVRKDTQGGNIYGYAKTPQIGYDGDVILSFKYGNTSMNSSSISMTVVGKGVLDKNTISITNQYAVKIESTSIIIRNAASTDRIKFSIPKTINYYYIIDDVVVTKDILGENADNQYYIAAHEGNTTDVQTTRTLIGGIWNTLCLPFNVTKATMEAALGKDQDIQMRTFSSYADNVMTFDVVADDAVIEAGTQFLIKLNTTVDNPTFKSVTISNTAAQTINNNGVCFVGTYSTTTLNADGTHLFITTDGKLAIPTSDGTTMKGMRAYISVPEEMKFSVSGARLVFNDINDDEPSSVQTPTRKKTPSAIYNLNGQRLQQLRKGLNIIDGKLRVTTTR